MLSLPDTWDYSLNGLASICGDGVSSIGSGIRELEKQGYVTREQQRNNNGQLGKVEYIVREIPVIKNGLDTAFSPQSDFPFTVDPLAEKPKTEECIQSNTNKSSTNQSIFHGMELNEVEGEIKNQLTSLMVRRFQMLDSSCIIEIIGKLKNQNVKIIDMRAYLLKCLFVEPTITKNQFESNFQHDFPEFAPKEKSMFDGKEDIFDI